MKKSECDPYIKIEPPKGRTYGECVMDEIMSMKMIDGEFRIILHIKEKPKRLGREDALIYYAQKLRKVWVDLAK